MKKLLLLASAIFVLFSQNHMMIKYPTESVYANLQMNKASFAGVSFSTFSALYDLTIIQPMSETFSIQSSVTFSTVTADGSEGSSSLGNLYFGGHFGIKIDDEGHSYFSLGAYIPTSERDLNTLAYNLGANFFEMEKYTSDLLTLKFIYHSKRLLNKNLFLIGRVGPKIYITTGNNSETDMFMDLSFGLGFQNEQLDWAIEYQHLLLLTVENADFIDKFISGLNLSVNAHFGSIHPGIFYRAYIDDLFFIDNTLGFSLSFDLPN